MKRRYYVQKTEMIEVDEPIFETLSAIHAANEVAEPELYEEAVKRLEAITGEKVCEGIEDWEVGITDIYTEDGITIFNLY